MPAIIATVVITIGRARFWPASMIAASRHPAVNRLDGEVDQHDRILGDDAHQHQDADRNRHRELHAADQKRDDGAPTRRQREQR